MIVSKSADDSRFGVCAQVILGGAFLLAYLGIMKWPFDWFKEWPEDWANYPDMAQYGAQR